MRSGQGTIKKNFFISLFSKRIYDCKNKNVAKKQIDKINT